MKLKEALQTVLHLAQAGLGELVGHSADPEDQIAIDTVSEMMSDDAWGFTHQFNYQGSGELMDYIHIGVDQFVILVSKGKEYIVSQYTQGEKEWHNGNYFTNPNEAVLCFFEKSRTRLATRIATEQGKQNQEFEWPANEMNSRTLRSQGYAVIIWTPEELAEASPRRVEDRSIELGHEVIADLNPVNFDDD